MNDSVQGSRNKMETWRSSGFNSLTARVTQTFLFCPCGDNTGSSQLSAVLFSKAFHPELLLQSFKEVFLFPALAAAVWIRL